MDQTLENNSYVHRHILLKKLWLIFSPQSFFLRWYYKKYRVWHGCRVKNTRQSRLRHSFRLRIHTFTRVLVWISALLRLAHWIHSCTPYSGKCTLSSQLMSQLTLVGYSSHYTIFLLFVSLNWNNSAVLKVRLDEGIIIVNLKYNDNRIFNIY